LFYNSGEVLYNFPDWSLERFASSDFQLMYATNGIYEVDGLSGITTFEDWQSFHDHKFDQRSLHALPKFMNAAEGDYRLRYDSPARQLGIQGIDFANIGLLDTFVFRDNNDPLRKIYPVNGNGNTISELVLDVSEAENIDVVAL